MEEIEEVGQLVGKKLIIGGYIYVRSKPSKNNQFYWDCQLVRRKECKARAITLQTVSELIVLKGPKKSPHEHPPNQDTAKAELVKVNLKRVAEDHPECPPAQVQSFVYFYFCYIFSLFWFFILPLYLLHVV